MDETIAEVLICAFFLFYLGWLVKIGLRGG